MNPVEQEPAKASDQTKVNNVAPEGSINFIEAEDDRDVEVNGLFKMEICKPGEQKKDVILSSPANPLIINFPKRSESLYQVPPAIAESKTITASDVVITNITGIGGMTRSGRCYTPEELERRRKGKDKVGEEPIVTFPEEDAPVKEPVTEKDVEDFLKYVKNSEYNIIEQLSKTPAKISLLSLILHSDLHRKALLKVLNESHISSDASVAQVERLVGQIQAPNYLTFSDEELGPEGRGHNKPLSIAVSYRDFHITKVLVDNGSYINVLPKSTFDSLNIDPLYVRETDAVAKAFNGTKVTASGELELPIKIGPHIFNIDFHIMDTKSSYTMLLGRPWIHSAGAVPSSLHQKLKYVRDCCLIEISAEHEYAIKQITGPPGVGSTEAGEEEFLRGFEIVAVTPVSEGSRLTRPRLPKQILSAVKTTIAIVGKKSLKRRIDESLPFIYPKKYEGTFGLGFKPSWADMERAKINARERKRARLAGRAYDEQPLVIPSSLQAFRSGGFINPVTILNVIKSMQDLHISVITNDSRPLPIQMISEEEVPLNYTITPLIFPEM